MIILQIFVRKLKELNMINRFSHGLGLILESHGTKQALSKCLLNWIQ